MKLLSGLLAVALCLVLPTGGVVTEAYAAGGGSMGGGGGGFNAPAPRKSKQQQAIDNYNRGIAARDKAEAYEEQLVSAETEKQRKKLNKKITSQYKKAAKAYRSAIKNQPRLYQAHGSLGYALKKLGDWEKAMASYDEALRIKPEYTPAIEYRAEAYLALARYDDVKEAHSFLAYKDRGHKKELEVAIAAWLETTQRDDSNSEFYDWATELTQ